MAWFGFKEAAGGWRMVYPFRRVQGQRFAAAVAGPCGFEFRRADGRGSGIFGPGGRSPAMQRCPWQAVWLRWP